MARFVLDGRLAAVWLDTEPSTPTAPTQAELTAGTDLIGTPQAEELFEIEGFEVQNSTVPTPGYASNQVGNVTGEQTYPDSRMAWYKDDTDEEIYDTVVGDATGYVALMLDGQAATNEVETFPVTVSTRVRRKARNAAHGFDANFAIAAPFVGVQAA